MLINCQTASPITSVVNTTSIDMFRNLLAREDYVDAAEKPHHPSDIMNMLDFILFVLCNRYLSSSDPDVDTNRRARQLMSKIISKSCLVPRSLFLMGLPLPSDGDLISGGFGHVYKGEHEGKAVALKALNKNRNYVVCHPPINLFKSLSSISFQKQDFCRQASMWRSLDHKFVLPFLGIYENEAGLQFLVSPYMTNGTLAQWRKRAMPSLLEMEMRVRFILFL